MDIIIVVLKFLWVVVLLPIIQVIKSFCWVPTSQRWLWYPICRLTSLSLFIDLLLHTIIILNCLLTSIGVGEYSLHLLECLINISHQLTLCLICHFEFELLRVLEEVIVTTFVLSVDVKQGDCLAITKIHIFMCWSVHVYSYVVLIVQLYVLSTLDITLRPLGFLGNLNDFSWVWSLVEVDC